MRTNLHGISDIEKAHRNTPIWHSRYRESNADVSARHLRSLEGDAEAYVCHFRYLGGNKDDI